MSCINRSDFLLPATTELRQAWVNSIKNEKIGSRLPVRKLPFCLLRQQVCGRRLHCKTADPFNWKSDEDKKKIADKRKCFDRQWTKEISKRYLLSVYKNKEINIVSGMHNLETSYESNYTASRVQYLFLKRLDG